VTNLLDTCTMSDFVKGRPNGFSHCVAANTPPLELRGGDVGGSTRLRDQHRRAANPNLYFIAAPIVDAQTLPSADSRALDKQPDRRIKADDELHRSIPDPVERRRAALRGRAGCARRA